MILFLTLIYVAFLAILVKLKIVRFNLFWKLSPLLWMLMLTVVLFIPMQWGAPSGVVNVYRMVVEIVPNVSGEVIEVNTQGSKPISKGDVLFRLDPQPYQIEVDRLLAAVKEAEQTAKMLPAGLAEADANVAQAEAAIVAAKQQAASLNSTLVAAKANVAKSQAQLELAQTESVRAKKLLASNATSEEDAATKERNVELAMASVEATEASRQQAELALESTIDGVNTSVIEAQERLKASQAAKQKAELAVASTINGENTQVAQLRAQLATAQFNLAQTTVVAPSDGFVIGMTLQPGQRVAAFPVRTWMAFVDSSSAQIAVGIDQNRLRHVKPGQKADVVLELYPGRTFSATVDRIAYITPQGQLQPTGTVATAPSSSQKAMPFGVVLTLEDAGPDIDIHELPGGVTGTAAIYTDSVKATHLIRRVMIRMETFMNYIMPS
ncbi:HlyD family secretion protein [Aporhodopirellula aestuarii]|uniref:Biotin/lipoyl-binding protein n=1 Tax=Aporhodopirellula aestuarii TaxID=2950107 RepID=A0ABT0TY05_9BACT|nr:HlyD family efflux transporter periplasmic adaptor subunit [Aporhodopirellula aestuarii]MCM2369455.1 biotin/lipoyl-binding protein [Aporhodopirellula aestuarii]